jgi:Tfp pilus assembly protein PilX
MQGQQYTQQSSNRNTSLSFENGRTKRNSNIMNLGVLTPNNFVQGNEPNSKASKYISKQTHQTIDVNERHNYQITTPNNLNYNTAQQNKRSNYNQGKGGSSAQNGYQTIQNDGMNKTGTNFFQMQTV